MMNKNFKHVKAERILVVLYTDKDGRKLVGGMDIDSGRDWLDVYGECADVILETGKAVTIRGKDPDEK